MADKAGAGGAAPRFKDEEGLRRWLETQPSEVCALIAARAALRVLPWAALDVPEHGGGEGQRRFAAFFAVLFRTSAFTWVAGKYPTRANELRAAAARADADAAARADAAAAYTRAAYARAAAIAAAAADDGLDRAAAASDARAAAEARAIRAAAADEAYAHAAADEAYAHAAAVDSIYAAAHAAYAAAHPAAGAAHGFAAAGAAAAVASAVAAAAVAAAYIWSAVSNDATSIRAGTSVRELAEQPLWPDGVAPDWVAGNWERMRAALPGADGWDVWIDWYEDRLKGGPVREEIELLYATVPLEKWEEGPAAANAWISAELEKLKPPWTKTLSTLIEAPLGNRWTLRDDRFHIDPKGDESDIAAAREPVTRQLYQALQRKAEAFAKLCAGIDDRHGWSGLEAAIARFHEEVSRDIDEIPAFIASVYDATVELGSFLDLDNDIRQAKNTNTTPLDPEVRRAFADLIRTAAPWVRGFPTARDLDDQTGAFLARRELFDPASKIVAGASAHNLISDRDRDLILALLAALERDGLVSHKAGVRGVQTVKGLTFKFLALLATFYSGAISSSYSNDSPIVKKISGVLVAQEIQITKILHDTPGDIRLALQAALDDLKRHQRDDIPPLVDGLAPKPPKRQDEDEKH